MMHPVHLKQYDAFFFDCDGVILNSNKVKTAAFYKATLPYGEELAQQFVDYHVDNGGISRYSKFNTFLADIVPEGALGPSLDELLSVYAAEVRQGLLDCDIAQGLVELRKKTEGATWFVVSGGDQAELRETFETRGLSSLFNGGIYGSPDTKDDILKVLLKLKTSDFSGVFIGDSKYDYLAANKASLDFVFVSDWSDFLDWKAYFDDIDITSIRCLHELV